MIETRQQIVRREVTGSRGMVTAMHPLAARAGARVLQEGGNAVDAAVTIGFAVSVVEPFMSGLGGRGGMLIHRPGKPPVGVDYTLRAGKAASPEMWRLAEPARYVGNRSWRAVVDGANHTGHLAIGVPGVVAGLAAALERYGTISLARALEPAIDLAENGFEIDWFTALMILEAAPKIRRFPATADVFFEDGLPRRVGSRMIQKDLAATLREIAKGGPEAFYRGRFARLLAQDMAANGGLLTEADLAAYEPTFHEPPLVGTYRGYEVLGTLEASGSATVVEALNILEGYDLATLGRGADVAHLTIEALRQAFADKIAYIGDPDFVDVPLQGLTSKAYADEVRRSIGLDRAASVPVPGDPWPFEGRPGQRREPAAMGVEGENTTGITAVDGDGNAVSLSQTHSPLFGSGVTVPGTGVLMNAAMQGFDPEPDHPNSVGSWKRPVWSNSPIMLRKDGQVALCIASPGSRRVISAEVQVILNVLDFGMSVEEAVAAPRLHAEPAATDLDDRIDPAIVDELRRRGHALKTRTMIPPSNSFGRPSVILRDPRDGLLHGCSEPYGPGTVEAL